MPTTDQKIEKKILKAINKRFNNVTSSYQIYANNPYVSEYVHRFRVDMRKMRALLNFIKPILGEGVYDELNQQLRELGQRLSPIRDLDTLIEECTRIANEEPDWINNYAAVFRFLEKERLKLINKESTKKVYKEFNEVLKQIQVVLDQLSFELEAESLNDFVEKRYEHKTKKLSKDYKKLNNEDYEEIHEVRKQAKKVRYTSAGYKKILANYNSKQTEKAAKKIQKELGKLTDSHVMIDLMNEYKEKTDSKKIKKSFQKLIDYQKNKL